MIDGRTHAQRVAQRDALAGHYVEYLAAWERDAEEELNSIYWMTKQKEKHFQKAIKGMSKTDFLSPLLKASERAMMGCYACQLVLYGDPKGWGLLARAADPQWWAFYFAQHAGSYEGATAMLLPFSYLVGHFPRADFIGRCLFEGSAVARRYVDDSIIGRFVARLWALDNNVQAERLDELAKLPNERAHNFLVANLFQPCSIEMVAAITAILDFHLDEASREDGELKTADLFYLMPLELLYFIEIRRKRGIETASINHPLLDTPLAVLPTTTAWLSEVWEFALPEYIEAIAALGIRPADELARFRMHAEAIEL